MIEIADNIRPNIFSGLNIFRLDNGITPAYFMTTAHDEGLQILYYPSEGDFLTYFYGTGDTEDLYRDFIPTQTNAISIEWVKEDLLSEDMSKLFQTLNKTYTDSIYPSMWLLMEGYVPRELPTKQVDEAITAFNHLYDMLLYYSQYKNDVQDSNMKIFSKKISGGKAEYSMIDCSILSTSTFNYLSEENYPLLDDLAHEEPTNLNVSVYDTYLPVSHIDDDKNVFFPVLITLLENNTKKFICFMRSLKIIVNSYLNHWSHTQRNMESLRKFMFSGRKQMLCSENLQEEVILSLKRSQLF